MNGIGSRIREARVAQEKSLSEIATRAKISAATLSRIETEKQGVGISLFLLLAKVLRVHPSRLLGEPEPSEESMAEKVAGMKSTDRTQLWHELSAIRHDGRSARRDSAAHNNHVGAQIDELLAQIDYLRAEIDSIRSRLPARPRTRR